MSDEPFTLHFVEKHVFVVTAPTGLGTYDYEFVPDFVVAHPAILPVEVTAIARMGAANDYSQRYHGMLARNIRLIHSPEQYRLCSELPWWYERISSLTARSLWFTERPRAAEVGAALGWPVFVKGARQTSRHQKAMCVAENAEQFDRIMDEWAADPILWWQPIVCRAWLDLKKVSDRASNLLPITYEFRSFWYRQELVGFGRYWRTEPYSLDEEQYIAAIATGQWAAVAMDVPFLVVDLGMLASGEWVVIECNDGQDAGYADIRPRSIWQRIVEIEARSPSEA